MIVKQETKQIWDIEKYEYFSKMKNQVKKSNQEFIFWFCSGQTDWKMDEKLNDIIKQPAKSDKKLLKILTWKTLCFTEKIHWNTSLAASDVFHMFTQSITFF